MIALLFGGVYLVLFVLPLILPKDQFLAQELQRQEFKLRFDHRLQLIGEGRYWFKTADVGLQDDANSEEARLISELLSRMRSLGGAALSPLPVLNKHELSRKEFAILAAGHGGASVTQDGGRNWSTPKGLELRKTEWLVAAGFDPTGAYGVVGGDEGSVFITR